MEARRFYPLARKTAHGRYWRGLDTTATNRLGDAHVKSDVIPDFGFYYPGQYWRDADWIKNLVLFFDGIAMLIPEYMEDQGSFDDYPIVAALKDCGLFNIVRPEEAVGAEETEQLSKALGDIIASGGLDHLIRVTSARDRQSSFGSLSMSRIGYAGNPELAQAIFGQLKERGWARDSEDGVSVPMHRTVRTLILVLLAQILRGSAVGVGMTLSPVTDRWNLVYALKEIISPPSAPPSVGDVVSFDLSVVGVDLSGVPLDEILDFRKQNYNAHRDYRISVVKFADELSRMQPRERDASFEQRQEELDAMAQRLRRVNWKAWKRPATFALSAANAFVAYENENSMAGGIAALLAIVGLMPDDSNDSNVYSYLMSARQKWYI